MSKSKHFLFVLFCVLSGYGTGWILSSANNLRDLEPIVVEEARAFHLDPQLVMAIIITESGGYVKVVSNKGAVGLMQILPSTAEELSRDLDLSWNEELLLCPRVNVRMGCLYMYRLLHRFAGNYELALAAYNAGPTRVQSWVEELGGLSPSEILASKASRETKHFVRQVLQRWEK